MAGLHLLGYSINTLTLFGMVLAIGIVVDDAIVVLENVERLMNEEGMTPKAAIEAMQEVTGPVIAIVLVLVRRLARLLSLVVLRVNYTASSRSRFRLR
jgi:multidrug efflux pump subunit AcrB